MRIFRTKRDEVTGRCRKLHSEELHNLYSSANIIRMDRACSKEKKGANIELWLENLKERDFFEYLDVDGKIILK
jgi:hypothetical protein